MGVKCNIPTCRSYTNSPSGLCNYHEGKTLQIAAASDSEQITPEERNRYKLQSAQAVEKFSAAGAERERKQREWEERQQRCKANYGTVWQQMQGAFENLRSRREAYRRPQA